MPLIVVHGLRWPSPNSVGIAIGKDSPEKYEEVVQLTHAYKQAIRKAAAGVKELNLRPKDFLIDLNYPAFEDSHDAEVVIIEVMARK